MAPSTYDVVAVGNAIIDIMQAVPELFLAEENIAKDAMTLIDEARADHLTARLDERRRRRRRLRRQHHDRRRQLRRQGRLYRQGRRRRARRALHAANSAPPASPSTPPPRPAPPGTARSLIAVTPDGHRSMNTYLGASTLLAPDDIDAELIRAGATLFLEGYLFDRDEAKAAFVRAAEIARGRRAQGRAHAVGHVLRRPPPRQLPAPGRRPRRHPVLERSGDPLALRERRISATALETRAQGLPARRRDALRASAR